MNSLHQVGFPTQGSKRTKQTWQHSIEIKPMPFQEAFTCAAMVIKSVVRVFDFTSGIVAMYEECFSCRKGVEARRLESTPWNGFRIACKQPNQAKNSGQGLISK